MRVGQILGFAFVMASSLAFAGPTGAPPPAPEETYHWQLGPKPLDLGHDVEVQLPTGYVFLGMPDADRFLRKNGSFNNEGVLGIVMSADEKQSWGVIIDYDEPGHVDDNEKIDAPKLLSAIREGTEENNKQRVEAGFSPLHVGDWTEEPHYDRTTHRLVWALPATSEKNGTTINYNTRVLGRRGVVSLNLLSAPDAIAVEKTNASTLLAATTFKQGARYEDFDKKTDKVAEFGLMGLILGGAGIGAAKLVKVGLIAGAWKWLVAIFLAAKKAVIALFVFIGAGIKRLFGGKKAGEPVAQKETKLPPTGTDGQNQG